MTFTVPVRTVLLGAAFALCACNPDKPQTPPPAPAESAQPAMQAPPPAQPAAQDPATATYAPALKVDIKTMKKTSGGVYYQDLVVGKGERADTGKNVAMDYTGWTTDGNKFDSSEGREPYQFIIGPGQVINGWHQGIPGMKVGGKRLLVIPPDLGYGAGGNPPIPGGAVLVFVVELKSVK